MRLSGMTRELWAWSALTAIVVAIVWVVCGRGWAAVAFAWMVAAGVLLKGAGR